MKLYATTVNERGGKKSTGDDTRLRITLSYKNKEIGTIGLYSVIDEGKDLGYRLVWDSDPSPQTIIREEVKSVKLKIRYCNSCGYVEKQYSKNCVQCNAVTHLLKGEKQIGDCKCYRMGFHDGKGREKCYCDCHE